MKVGDMVRRRSKGSFVGKTGTITASQAGLVVDVIQKKMAYTSPDNSTINWDDLSPEPFAVVLLQEGYTISIPEWQLEVICEAG